MNNSTPLRAVIYARYSTDMQRSASITDQIELCRRYVERQGWTLTGQYEDAAVSGASVLTRAGFQRLMRDAPSGTFDVVVTEAIDRLGRNLSDVARCFDQLSFHRVQIHAVNLGQVTQLHIGIMGTMAQIQLTDLGQKTKRGQLGRTRAGKSAGGLAYGYDVVPPPPGSQEAGERRINPAQAEIVQRIFRDYAAGKAPRTIAADLNRYNIPGPGGRPWGDTTIRGQADRGTGILNNTLYIGQLVWNRCSYVKDPNTGKRVARPNSPDQYETTPVPDLRIIEDELWQQVKARQDAVRTEMGKDSTGNPLNRAHRRKFLLSGLMRCGCCGAPYAMLAQDRFGCSTRRSKGTCDNSVTINRQRIETRVLAALQNAMLTPELVAHFIKTYEAEITRRQKEAGTTQARLQTQLGAVQRRLEGILRAIENGAWNNSLKQRLDELEAEKQTLQAQLVAADTPAPKVQLHPNAASLYASRVTDLLAALNDEQICGQAAEALSGLIEKVVLTPDASAPDGLQAELHGDLAMILSLAATASTLDQKFLSANVKNPRSRYVPEGLLSVVAGARFERATFRL
jgi:DNA invertase Pin-like site-specific DNA recombinase